MVFDISCEELASRLDDSTPIALLDVREDWELEICAIRQALHIPLSELSGRVDELAPDVPLAIICHHGVRSRHAGRFLEDRGFKEVFNVRGGIDAWALEVERDMSRYD
ncbi:sulfurtransferase [Thalassospira sp. HJ]|uniref:rhodanese-like domain-containing protein n=1 Tax=Thalassospira sp. HJ TaxID=1616823 RepID=UPI0005CDDDEF|nr:rhodanese-like domain-containing protein [Thalassospira sp. HJ]KJE35469.1 sulfurtransferase [Thalassospira sp. HJ]